MTARSAAESTTPSPAPRRPRSLALGLVSAISERVRAGQLNAGDKLPTEAVLMAEFEVSRTVVREAISKLQAAGLVETRHGIGTFVLGLGEGGAFRITPEQMGTLKDVVAVLELRIGVETEAAALAAQRRTPEQVSKLTDAVAAFADAATAGRDAIAADFQFHNEIARATGNPHYEQLMATLGMPSIPRSRLPEPAATPVERKAYLLMVNAEHERILQAIAEGDAEAAREAMRAHLSNSRERRSRAAALAMQAAQLPPAAPKRPVATRRKQRG